MRYLLTITALVTVLGTSASAAVQGREVEYRDGDTVMKGYIAYDDSSDGKRPGVLVVHEWWGHNEYARERARMLAGLGYTALAVDMYGDGRRAMHPEEAGKFAAAVRDNMPVTKARFRAAMDELKRHPTVDRDRIAAIGYCFGGSVVLEMALSGLDLDGVVSFHGSLPSKAPEKSGEIKARILVLNGADDPMITKDQIAQFRKVMEETGAQYDLVNYPGAKHSFTNPQVDEFGKKFNLPLAYHPEADAQSWLAMRDFLDDVFK